MPRRQFLPQINLQAVEGWSDDNSFPLRPFVQFSFKAIVIGIMTDPSEIRYVWGPFQRFDKRLCLMHVSLAPHKAVYLVK
jgi:hypothetical protein